jgi:hypothetical protein
MGGLAQAHSVSSEGTHILDAIRALPPIPPLSHIQRVVLSAETRDDGGRLLPRDVAAEITAAVNRIMPLLHRQLADESEHGIYQRVEGTGHYLHQERPEAVIEVIREITRKYKGSAP